VRIRIVVAGKPALAFAKAGVDEYLGRLRRSGPVELVFVPAGAPAAVSRELLARSSGCFRIALDERGEPLTTRALAARLAVLEGRGEIKTVAFLIGAADGHDDGLRRAADLVLALSPLTLQHELALVVLLEQLYRVADLRRGGPYHR
jgi:23S rRNA (pseudouridine1915-N3)-methyltransferase